MRPTRYPAAIVLAILLLVYAAGGAARAYVPPASPLFPIGGEYLALGDSLATGVGSSYCPIGCSGQGGYVAGFARRLEKSAGHAVSVTDLGIAGETSESFIGDFFSNPASTSQLARAVAEIRAHGARISPITLDIGGNDALNVRGSGHSPDEKAAALARFRANFARIVATLDAELQAAGGQANLILLAYYDPYGQDDPDYWGVARLNQTILDVGGEYGLRVAEPFAAFAGAELQLTWMGCSCPIGVHPTDRGYGLLTDALAAVSYGTAAPAGSVTGAVYGPDGSTAAGAWVWYGDGITRADARGRFRFDGVGVSPGLRFVAIDAGGQIVGEDTAAVAQDETAIVDISLGPPDASVASPAPQASSAEGYARIAAAIGRSLALHARHGTAQAATHAAGRAASAARSTGARLRTAAGDLLRLISP